MQYNELRKDFLLDRWVVIAKERSRRPTDFAKPKDEAAKNAAVCPLCVGNEGMTPPATMLYLKQENEVAKSQDPPSGERPKNWLVRVIPNLFPAFSPPKQPEDTKQIVENACLWNAIGAHEVIVESPNHDDQPSDADLPQLQLLMKAYVERFKVLGDKSYVKYVSIFRNHGLEAGASLTHAHSQVIATPMVPTLPQDEQKAAKTYYLKNEQCVFCNLIEQERQSSRFILENNDFLVFAPYASIFPMEFWIAPKKHASNIHFLTQQETGSLAKILKVSLKALKDVVNDPPYNYGFHLSLDPIDGDSYHWHLEVYPKLSIWAGFEKSTGCYINTITPETAAESLRNAIKP